MSPPPIFPPKGEGPMNESKDLFAGGQKAAIYQGVSHSDRKELLTIFKLP